MGTTTIRSVFQFRRATASEWESVNPILRLGEPGYATDTKEYKIGDGETTWTNLPSYAVGNDIEEALSKIDEVQENITVLESQVTTSTDNVVELQTVIEQKADISAVTELQTVVEQKADASTVYTKEEVDNLIVGLDPENEYIFSGGDI